MTDRAARGQVNPRDCEGGDIASGGPGQDHTNMGMDVEIKLDSEADDELEDAPWCVNGARVRYDGSVIGVCRVCRVFGKSEFGDCDTLLGRAD
jgi:hypothetical protein